jgi:hypothetical protein
MSKKTLVVDTANGKQVAREDARYALLVVGRRKKIEKKERAGS